MSEIKHLISISTYKESENIESLIKIIRQYDKDTKILLINDFSGDHTTEIVNKIKELLDTRVRPAVAQDGGDITFHGYDSGIVYLHMQGACAGCPSSTMTLKMGIENLLKHFIPEVQEVRPIAA